MISVSDPTVHKYFTLDPAVRAKELNKKGFTLFVVSRVVLAAAIALAAVALIALYLTISIDLSLLPFIISLTGGVGYLAVWGAISLHKKSNYYFKLANIETDIEKTARLTNAQFRNIFNSVCRTIGPEGETTLRTKFDNGLDAYKKPIARLFYWLEICSKANPETDPKVLHTEIYSAALQAALCFQVIINPQLPISDLEQLGSISQDPTDINYFTYQEKTVDSVQFQVIKTLQDGTQSLSTRAKLLITNLGYKIDHAIEGEPFYPCHLKDCENNNTPAPVQIMLSRNFVPRFMEGLNTKKHLDYREPIRTLSSLSKILFDPTRQFLKPPRPRGPVRSQSHFNLKLQ